MQEYINDELVKTKILEEDEQTGNLKLPEMQKNSTHQVVGKMPKKNQIFTLNGLRYRVTRSDFIRGKFVAKILMPGG